jgi:DNA polymerase (family X)
MVVGEIIEYLKTNKKVIRADALGSLRRMTSTVGDIDIAVSTNSANEILSYFTKYPKGQRIIEQGDRTASIMIPGNIRVDLMVEGPEAYGALLQHFTGSKHHNIALRELALKKKLSLSDYGIYETKGNTRRLNKIKTEEDFYKFLGMDYIPPELREDTGEIKAALEHKLPKLVELKDIKSDFHIHSDFDIETSHDLGESDMEQLVLKADSLGYEYIALSEHNPSQQGHTDAQIIELLRRKKESIEQINYSLHKNAKRRIKHVFNSLEIDIRPDGSLPVPKEGLELLDFALVSIHSSFNLSKKEMTDRVLKSTVPS